MKADIYWTKVRFDKWVLMLVTPWGARFVLKELNGIYSEVKYVRHRN